VEIEFNKVEELDKAPSKVNATLERLQRIEEQNKEVDDESESVLNFEKGKELQYLAVRQE